MSLSEGLFSGTLRAGVELAGPPLPAGTWFELMNSALFRTRPPAT